MIYNTINLHADQLELKYTRNCARAFEVGLQILKSIGARIDIREEDRDDDTAFFKITLPYSIDHVPCKKGGMLCAHEFTIICNTIKKHCLTPQAPQLEEPTLLIENYFP